MYLSPQVSDDEGTYFSYPVSAGIRQTNIRTCLPGGFSGSGPEYSMYRSNCLDLMAEECGTKWGPECDAYHSNLSKGEQEVLDQLIDRRNAPGVSSCVRGANPIVPGQTVRYCMAPMIQGTGCQDNIVMPQSCAYARPESVIEDSSQEDRERQEELLRAERARHEVYEQQQARRKKEHFQSEIIYDEARREVYEQQQARRKKEHFQSDVEHDEARREMYEQQQDRRKKEHFQSEFIQQQMYQNEQARRKEHFQSEMIQRGLYESRRPMREKFQAQFMSQAVPSGFSHPSVYHAPPEPEPVPQPFIPSEAKPEPVPQPFMPSEPKPEPQPFMPSEAVAIPVHQAPMHAPVQPMHAQAPMHAPPAPHEIHQAPQMHAPQMHAPQMHEIHQAPMHAPHIQPPQIAPQVQHTQIVPDEPYVHGVTIPVHTAEVPKEENPAYVFGVPTDCEQQACSVSNLLE